MRRGLDAALAVACANDGPFVPSVFTASHMKLEDVSPEEPPRDLDLVAIAAITDHARRARAAHDALRVIELDHSTARAIRQEAVRELRRQRWTWTAIASLLGVHRNRAAHLLDGASSRAPVEPRRRHFGQ